MSEQRYILRRDPKGGAQADEVAGLLATLNVRVLDQGKAYFFVLTDGDTVAKAVSRLSGWSVTPESRVPLPDVRPKIAARAGGGRSGH
jgi:hypothetical protein